MERTNKVTHQIVTAGAASLELPPVARTTWATLRRRWALLAGAILIAAASTAAYAAIGPIKDVVKTTTPEPRTPAFANDASEGKPSPEPRPPVATSGSPVAAPSAGSEAPVAYSVIVGSFRQRSEAESLSTDLQALGFSDRAIRIRVATSASGAWHQVLAGPYTDAAVAGREHARVRQIPGYGDARLIIH